MTRKRFSARLSILTATVMLGAVILAMDVHAQSDPYSPEEIRQLQALQQDLARFKDSADSYKGTVNGIVRRAYERRRQRMLGKFNEQISEAEKEERTRRIAAITLFEDFLRRYPNDKRWTPDVIFRLAELYFEKSHDQYLMATEQYEQELKRFDRKEIAVAPNPPRREYTQTISLHRRLIREFPRYRLIDGAYYLLGFCLSEMGEQERANEAFLALICSNLYRVPLQDEALDPNAKKATSVSLVAPSLEQRSSVYANCKALRAESRFNSEAWIRVGEHHFDENQLGPAIAAYRKVLDLGPVENPYYDEALYKLAWTYYRADKFPEAISNFDRLVVYADKEFERTGKAGSEMRPESIQYLGISFAEDDWDGDQRPDAEAGLKRIERIYSKRRDEKHVYEIYRWLGNIYYDTTKYEQAIDVYKLILKRWPYRADNPDVQDRIITALERLRQFELAINEREEFTRLFGKNTEWEKRNRNNPAALKKAQEYDEQALIQAAVFHHKAGQELKKRGLAIQDIGLLKQASEAYGRAAKAYEKYLERFPNTKNSYEIRYSYANCLFFSQRFVEAGKAFGLVRDSNLDNRYQEEAAFSATKSYEENINLLKRKNGVTEPPLPTAKTTKVEKINMPDVYTDWQKSLDAYGKRLPNSPKTARLSYKAAEISYRFMNFDDARKRFSQIYNTHCQDPMAITAGQAILVTYQLEKNLDKMQDWATRLSSGKCGGKAGEAGKIQTGARTLLVGIKFKRAESLFAKAEKLHKAGKTNEAAPYYDKAAAAYLALVDSNPQSSDADKALFNAGVAYEKSKRFDSATKIYERVWQQYPKSPLAGDALWASAQSYKRFFEFDRAVQNYLILADSPRFAGNKHRTDAIYNAAVILENDQAYTRAAKQLLRYADEVGKPEEAAEAYFKAGMIYDKMNRFKDMQKTLGAFPKKYGNAPKQGGRAVEAMFRIGRAADKRKNWTLAKRYYRATIQEFNRRGLQPASDAAEFAGHAAFQLAEKNFKAFEKLEIKGQVKSLVSKEKAMGRKAVALKKEYDGIVTKYRRARWTLAAMYRRGTIYEHFARAVAAGYRNAPVPKKVRRLGQEAVDIYMEQLDQLLDQRVRPLEEETKKLFAACVEQAKKLGVSNQYTESALRRLNALDPAAYPLLKAPKVKLAIE